MIPVYRVERAAKAIVRAAHRPKREIRVGGLAHVLELGSRVAPGLVEWSIARLGPLLQFKDIDLPATDGNLYASTSPEQPEGGWRSYWMRKITGKR